tara:strand:+ start:7819 stop:8019 length:201 start_codon:yes stop_codon:yes gene_type:complete
VIDRKSILVGIITLILGFLIGLFIGFEIVINRVTDLASRFVEIDKHLVEQAIFQYENNVRGCFPVK